MATAARLPIAADRVGACVRTIEFVGLDLTGVGLRMQVRLRPDTPGAPQIDLQTVTNANAEGVRLVTATTTSGVVTSVVRIRINESTMKDATKVPYAGEPGSASVLSYDLIGIFGNDKRRLMFGEFVALPTTYGADNAPAVPFEGSGASTGNYTAWSAATLTFRDDVVKIVIDGMELVAPLAVQAAEAARDAEAARGAATDARNVSKAWAEGPVPAGGTHSSKGWAEVAQAGAAIADTARAAVEQAISQVPSDTRLLLEAISTSVLRSVAADTPIGRLAHLAEPGREGVWQLRAGDYSAHVAADTYGTRYIKVAAVAATSRAWVRIVPDGVFRFSWTGLNADTADARPLLQAGINAFDPYSTWELPNHKMIIPSGDTSLTIAKPGITLTGHGRGTHLDYQGTAGAFSGLGLFLVSADDVTVEKMHFSLRAPGNSASNPSCIGVGYTQEFLDATTGTLPELKGTKIQEISFDRTSLGIVVGAYDRTNRADGGIGKPENTTIRDIAGLTNGVGVSLFGAGETDIYNYECRFDATIATASPQAKQGGLRILGASDINIGSGKIHDFPQGMIFDPDGSRIKNRRISIYGNVLMRNVTLPIALSECLEGFDIPGSVTALRSINTTDRSPVVSILSNQFLSAVDPALPAEEKYSVTQDVKIRNIQAEGYASFVAEAGEMGKLTIEDNTCVGNLNASDSFGDRFAVICRDPEGPKMLKINNNDFRISSSTSTPSIYTNSPCLVELQGNVLPERTDPESAISLARGSICYTDAKEQRPFSGIVNIGTNSLHPVGTLANYRNGTPIPPKTMVAAAWTRDLTTATVTESPTGKFTKTGAVAAFDGRVSSVEAMVGDFELVYRLPQITSVDGAVAVGIDPAADNPAFGSIDWAIHYGPASADFGSARPYSGSTALSVNRAYGVGTIERWRRFGSRLIFSRGDVDLFETSVSPDIAFKLQITFARQNHAVEILRFGPLPAPVSVETTPPPAPDPSFTTQPTVSPTNGTVGGTFTATPGVVSNGSITAREWRFGGSVVSNAVSYVALAAGTLTYQEFANAIASALRSVTVSPAVAALPKTSAIVAKWSADSLPVIANGAAVPSWTDEVGGNVATSLGAAVTYKTNSENGKPTTVWVGGSTCRMEVANPSAALLAALNSRTNTVMMVVKNANHTPGNFPNVFSASAGGDSISFVAGADFVGRNKNGPLLYVPTPAGGGMFAFGGTSTTDVSNGSGDGLERIYVEGGCVASFVGPMPATGGNTITIGNLAGAPAVGYFGYGGEIAEIIVWNTIITPVEWAQAEKWYCGKYGKPLPWAAAGNFTIFHGDSVTAGIPGTAVGAYPYKAAKTLGLPYGAWSNLGIGGITMANMNARAPAEVDPMAAMTGVPTHLAVFEWRNQRGAAPTPANASRAYLAARAAAGINKIAFGTSTDEEPANQNDRAAYNADFDNNHADSQAYVAIHLNGTIGTAGASANQTNFDPDRVHLRDPGYTVLGSLFATALATL